MRFATIFGTINALSNTTLLRTAPSVVLRAPQRITASRYMPSGFLGNMFGSGSKEPPFKPQIQKTDAEWRAQLTPEQFRVIRGKGTERAYTGKYDKHYPKTGVYNCAACDTPIFKANHKFDSGCGWPAFFDEIPGTIKRIEEEEKLSIFMGPRTEIVCKNCGGHLGHVFMDEPSNPHATKQRHCVNSVSINFVPEGKD